MKTAVRRRGNRGQGMVEYGLILSVVAMVVVVSLGGLGVTVKTVLWGNNSQSVTSTLDAAVDH